jgi:hypothetical protein
VVQAHPEARLRDELLERAWSREPLGTDALDAELLHDALGPEGARAEDLAHAATAERAAERVAAEPYSRRRGGGAGWRSALLFAHHLGAVCLALVVSAQARAEDLPKLVVVRERAPGEDAPAGLARELSDELTARGVPVRDAPAPAVVEALDARAALDEASRSYTALRPADARQRLEALLAHADANGTAGLDDASFARALLLLALAAQAMGDAAAADVALDRLLVVAPSYEADAATYPPPLRERLERRRAAVAALSRVALRVVTAPGAILEIDGHLLAAGQTELRVVPGRHLVRARAPSHVSVGQAVDVRADPTELALPLALDPGAVLAAPSQFGEAPPAALLSVARTLDAALLLVDVSRGPNGLVIDASDRASSRRARLVAPANLTAHALAVRIATALLAPARDPGTAEPRGPVLWPWLVAAGVAVAGAIVLGVALSVSDQPTGFVLVPEAP